MTDEDYGKECDAESRACYRSWTMRASYLSQDRCEGAVRREGICETDAAAESQEHAGSQALGAIPASKFESIADKLNSTLRTSSQTAIGRDARRPGGRLCLRT